jgi:hypothetical protein
MLLFCVFLLLSAMGADYLLTTGLRKSQKGEYGIWNDLIEGKVASNIVIYGSSRAWVHVDPKIVEDSMGVSCYNLGIDGHNFRMQYSRHQLLFRQQHRPRLIVLVLDYRTLDKRPDLFNPGQFLHYFDKALVRKVTREYKGFRTHDYYLPLIRYTGYREVIKHSLYNLFSPTIVKSDRYRGYKGQDRVWTGEFEKARLLMKHYYQPVDQASIRLFDQFLQQMQRAGIKLLLVYPPEYIEGQQFVSNRKAIFSLYYHFSKKYDVPFIDYSTDSLSFRKELFYNTQHLNKRGAELFTRSLVKKINYSKLIANYL